MNSLLLVVLSIILLFVSGLLRGYRAALSSARNHPGLRSFISPFGLLGLFFQKPLFCFCTGSLRCWYYKHQDYMNFGSDIITMISAFPKAEVVLQISDAAVIKEITTYRARFTKPLWRYVILSFFGPNIIGSEGEEWKRFRKISAPAFSDRNNRLVWDETANIIAGLLEDVWGDDKEVVVEHAPDLTFPMTLFIISIAGFGKRISWKDDLAVPANHKLAFKEALHTVSNDILVKLITPKWIMQYCPSKRLKAVSLGFEEFEQYMREMVHNRRTAEKKEERNDLLSCLLEASEEEIDATPKLTDDELLGNIFVFLVAGHETTAHTLCFAFALLALYPDKQEALHEHIKSVIPDGRTPAYEEMNLFTGTMAVLNETLRMYPPVHMVPKQSAEDTVLATTNISGNKVIVPCPQGTEILIDVLGLHFNPRYWDDPESFKPERFLGDWPRDAFLPFSGGARACLGRRFFEVSGVAILTTLASKYKITIREEPQFAHETFEERKERIMRSTSGLTRIPIRMPLVFMRRSD